MFRATFPIRRFFVLLSILSAVSWSASTDSALPESNTIHPDSSESLLVAVADFRATMLTRAEAGSLSDSFCAALVADRRLRVVDRKEFAGPRNPNDFGPLAQCTELGCALEIGRRFETDAVVIGAVSRKGKGLVLTIRLVEVEEKALRQKLASKVYADPEALLAQGVPELVARLIDRSGEKTATEGSAPNGAR